MPARVALVAVVGFLACQRAAPPAGVPTLALLTGLRGATEPCGCTSKPLGGLDRVAGMLARLRAAGPTAVVVSGDTFFERVGSPPHLFEIERRRATAIGDVLAKLDLRALLLGPVDTDAQPDWVHGLVAARKLPTLARPRKGAPPYARLDSILLSLGDVRIGIVGFPGEAAGREADTSVAATALRRQGADVVVALVPYGGEAGRSFVRKLDGVTVAILGGSEGAGEARPVGGTLTVEAGDKGRYVGVLRFLRRAAAASWVYDDQGTSARLALTKRLATLEAALAELPEGEAKVARAAKAAELRAQLAALTVATPSGNAITFSPLPVTKAEVPAAWATSLLRDYNQALCALSAKATEHRTCAPPAATSEVFIGNAKCVACHPDAVAVWQTSKHAHAWATLESAGKSCDLGCIACHTIGFEKPGGYCRLADALSWRDVGCESCHGPGAGHAKAPFDKAQRGAGFTRGRDPAVCGPCHTPEHSDLFDFAAYLPKILGPGHGQPAVRSATLK